MNTDISKSPDYNDIAAITQQEAANRASIKRWLYVVLVTLIALVVVGGATRLTDSGLSITEWKPINGIIPPLNAEMWQEEFDKYRQIPEYQLINKGMSMAAFQVIYWWEWAHRALARWVGLIFAVPLAWFWLRGKIEQRQKPRFLILLALGGLQGFIGWWMVSSGLTARVDVSQYRLAVHLTLASIIIAMVTYMARSHAVHAAPRADERTVKSARFVMILILIQIYLGALVAGMDAGLAYNTWPLMDGAVVPGGLLLQEPWWINFFENPKTVQFVHRTFAYFVLLGALMHFLGTRRREAGSPHATRATLLFVLMVGQALVGIITLVMQVPFFWALLHQAYALILLIVAVAHWRGTKGNVAPQTAIHIGRPLED